ncbi:MAG: crossover junction endodeoxyribonuclease RuvC [Candidatus Omnitrophota bacterium]
MRILGIDPGLNVTGYGLIETDNNSYSLLEAGVIKSPYKYSLPRRLSHIHNELSNLINEYKPQSLVLEKIFSHYKFPATVISIAYARGVACLLCGLNDIPLHEYAATRIKKALTGKGHASKEQVKRLVFYMLNINNTDCYADATDALALAIGHCRLSNTVLSICKMVNSR